MADLWVLAGQSNMEGVGRLVDVEPASERVRAFVHGDRWETAQEPLHWLLESVDPVHVQLMGLAPEEAATAREEARRTRERGAGLGLTFAKTLVERAGVDIDLVPCAHGGTSMTDWDPGRRDEGGASLYGAMLRRVREALASGGTTRLAGVLWYQGESDASAEAAPLYTERMEHLVSAFREDLRAPELPFYLVQLGTFANPDTTNEPSWGDVREQQRLLPERIEGTRMVPAVDLELDDLIHIGTQGHRRLGRRLANLALADVYGRPSPAPITVASVTRHNDVLRVGFGGVNGALHTPDPAGRVSGFALQAGDAEPNDHDIYRTRIAASGTAVELLLNESAPADARPAYGWGLQPFCQLADEADMAVPAFGPLDLA